MSKNTYVGLEHNLCTRLLRKSGKCLQLHACRCMNSVVNTYVISQNSRDPSLRFTGSPSASICPRPYSSSSCRLSFAPTNRPWERHYEFADSMVVFKRTNAARILLPAETTSNLSPLGI